MVFCQCRELSEHPGRLPHDQSYEAQCDTEIEEVQGYMVGGDVLTGEHHLEVIQPVTEDQKYGHKRYRAPVPFGTPLHVNKQRAQEVDYQIQVENSGIRPVEPGLEINGLFRDVGVPDEHKLVEPQISPEDRKGKLEFTQVMKVFFVDELQVTLIFEVDDEDGDQRHAGNEGAGEVIPGEHGRVPMRIDAHEPQPRRNRGYRKGKPYDKEGGPNGVLENIFLSFLDSEGGVVDAAGELAHFVAQADPQTNGECRPYRKEPGAKETALSFECFVVRNHILIQPFVDSGMSAKDQAHKDHEGDDAYGDHGSGDRLGDTAEGQDEPAHRQRDGAEEEHGRVYDKQEVHAVLQQCCPEAGALIVGAVEDKSDDQRDHAHCHQSQGPLLISAGYLEVFFNG